MSKTVSYNRTDTAVAGVPSLNLPVAVLNYKADFSMVQASPSELVLTNLTSPIDRPETIRYSVNAIKDIYKGTGIDPTSYSASRRGVSLLAQLTDRWTVADTVDTTYNVTLPVQAHMVLKLPADAVITPDMVKLLVGRLCDTLFNTGLITSERLNAMLRGSLLPADL